jgi:putative ABC transport system permease protein
MVCPMAWRFGMNVKRGDKQRKVRLWGADSNWHEAWRIPAVEGDPLSPRDVAAMARVCLIGKTVQRELFGDEDPIGGHIYVNNVKLEVGGILKARGVSPMGKDFDNYVLVPITTAMRRILNVDHVAAIRIITEDPDRMADQGRAIRALIHDRHRITPPEEDDFRIITPMIIAKLARGMSGTISWLLIILAGLSLIVGGIVLMNILLVSVNERTGEIGLRRALGASCRDIFAQFLAESLIVTTIGMVLGIGLGWGASLILVKTMKMPLVLSWEPFVLAAAFALLVGTVFGVQPARRAAALNPVDALR